VQVNVPIAQVDGAPVGLGLISARGSDEALLALAASLAALLAPTPQPSAAL
jgi:Asp-tRNA(Asn)/Glu-tRNA(Gln) amidotransferase A subunit family amidase